MDKMNEITLPHDHGHHNEEKIWKHLPAEAEISGVSEAMRQLGDPSRLRIFWLLCHCEECVQAGCASSGCSATARNA